jgi:hypothetical protein
MTKENIMKAIKGYEGEYSITESGRVWSHERVVPFKDGRSRRIKGRWLTPYDNGNGYQYIVLKDKKYSIHRLVAETYLPNPKNHPVINHLNKDRADNHVSNLEWCTQQRNVEHSRAKHYRAVNPDGEVVDIFNYVKFARDNGLDAGSFGKVLRGDKSHNTCKGWSRYSGT